MRLTLHTGALCLSSSDSALQLFHFLTSLPFPLLIHLFPGSERCEISDIIQRFVLRQSCLHHGTPLGAGSLERANMALTSPLVYFHQLCAKSQMPLTWPVCVSVLISEQKQEMSQRAKTRHKEKTQLSLKPRLNFTLQFWASFLFFSSFLIKSAKGCWVKHNLCWLTKTSEQRALKQSRAGIH